MEIQEMAILVFFLNRKYKMLSSKNKKKIFQVL